MRNVLIIRFVSLLALLISMPTYAYDFEVDDIYYNFNINGNSVGVTNGDNLYQGIVEIPSEVLYNGKNYQVTNIGNFAFANCSDLTSVTIPYSVIAINNYAFHCCSGLTSVIIPNSIKWIRERAFQGCSSLTSVTIPNSVTSIHATAFAGCFNLTSIRVDNGNTMYDSRDNCNAIIETTSNTIVFGCKNTIFPSSVISIGNNAFEGCEGLTSMEIPNSITSIGSGAFSGCSNLNSVSIPNSVTSIGLSAFYECSSLTSITIPNSISVIEYGAFWNSGLTSVIIPNSVTSIGAFAFCACGNLTSVLIPNSVTFIGKGAFENTGMTSVTIPSSVTSIAEDAFNSYTLSSVISEIKEPFPIKSWVFSPYTLTQGRLTVPEGTVVSYNSTEGWNEFQNIVEDKQFVEYTFTVKAMGNGSASYDGTTANNNTQTFTLNEGSSATITFTPDNGYRIKSVKVNSVDVTSSVSNNSYTVSNIKANTTVEVEFEAIPIPTYTLSVKATGNGSATYDGVTIRDNSSYYTVNEGEYATITFNPDEGYQIKSVMVNSSDVTSHILNNSYTIGGISSNTTVEVDFEAIPIPTYTLSVKATGNGFATYDGVTIRDNSSYFTVNEGEYATITFIPDEGYRIKSVMVNNFDVTSQILNNSYTISNINANTMVEVEFEAIATRKCTLTLKAMGNGSAWYNGVAVTNSIQTFSIEAGSLVIISFLPSDDYNIKSVKVDNVTTQISGNQYIINSISADTTIEVEFESDSNISGYTLTIKALGNGTVWYEKSVRNSEETLIIQPDSSPIIAFLPDTGYRIKSVKNNGEDVSSQVISNRYTISNVNTNITLEVEFEAIPATTYTLTITASGNGYVSYNGITASNNSKSFTLNEGTSATMTFSPDNGYRIKSVKVNSVDVTSIVSNNQYSINNINENTTVDVEFEEIPAINPDDDPSISGKCGENVYYYFDSQTQTLTISGEGDMYNLDFPWHSYCEDIHNVIIETGVSAIGKNAFRGCTGLTSVTIPNSVTSIGTFAFSGCIGLTSVTIPNSVTTIGNFAFEACIGLTSIAIPNSVTSIGEDSFDDCRGLTSVHISDLAAWCNINFFSNYSNPLFYAHHLYLNGKEIVDLVIPAGVTSIGNYAFYRFSGLTFVTIPAGVTSIGDYAFYDCNSLKTIVSEIETPYVIKSQTFSEETFINAELIVPKGTKAAYQTMGGWMNFVNIVEAEDTEPDQPSQIHINDIYYKVTGPGEAEVVSFEDGEKCVSIPSTISYNNLSYKVTSIAKDACESHEHLAAVIWEPEAQFNAIVNNPNFLLYVNNEKFASHTVKNVVVNGIAESIELTDAADGNDFYCPKSFRARNIVYCHNYQMETGLGESKGWETIVLPFDVQKYTHATKGELESFTTWTKGSNKKPFWLFELTSDGFRDVAVIKANTPYIISMPNNKQYEQYYQIPGIVIFSASDVEVLPSDNLKAVSYQGRAFVPNYTNQSNLDYLPLNVNSNYVTYLNEDAGSKFIGGLRSIHPFEAYMITMDNTRSIDVMDCMMTAFKDIKMTSTEATEIKVYDTKGILIKTSISLDEVRKGLRAGVYIINGKKMIIK